MPVITIFLSLAKLMQQVKNSLRCVENQTFSKAQTALFVDVTNLGRECQLLKKDLRDRYNHVVFARGDVARMALDYAIENNTAYFHVAENIILHPQTLERLFQLKLTVVAPMLTFDASL